MWYFESKHTPSPVQTSTPPVQERGTSAPVPVVVDESLNTDIERAFVDVNAGQTG